MTQISPEAIENIYLLAKQVYLRAITQEDAVHRALALGGMSEGSARDFIGILRNMLDGQRYVRTLSIEATEYFLRKIWDDFGSEGFSKAIQATRQHLEYYASLSTGGFQPTKTQLIDSLETEYLRAGQHNSMMRKKFSQFMDEQSVEGSNKASSYLRAIELLDPILASKGGAFCDCHDVYAVDSVARISKLYDFVLEQQRLAEKGMFAGEEPVSYWRDRYCSAALKSYREFLILHPYRAKLLDIYNEPGVNPADLTQKIEAVKAPFEDLVEDKDVDFATKEGKEKIRQVKTRVNQDFFREMILCEYHSECCLTGLNVPGVLRASHIVGWAEDKKNRLNPANGLCLSATYDAAFDRHLISFDDDYRMVLSSDLKEYYTNEAFKTEFLKREGQKITMPKRFHPDQAFLETHRGKLVV